jgi:putative ABC transport system permease protein
VLAWTIALAALVGVAFGLVPWIASGRTALAASLAAGRRGGTESAVRRRVRSSMVAAEVALSLALLTAAGLMVQSALNLQRRDLGFDPSGVVRGVVGLRAASYPTAEARVQFFATLRDRVASLPGVEAAGLASSSIFATRFNPRPIEGRVGDRVAQGEGVSWLVDEGYFDAFQIDLLRGRGFLRSDAGDAELVAVVSESLARDLFGDADPIGRQVRVLPFVMGGMTAPEPGPWGRVVGVVEGVVRDVGDERAGDLYGTYRQTAPLWMGVVARQRGGAATMLSAIEGVVNELDAEAPFSSPSFVEETVREAMAPTRYLAGLLTGFSAFALLLAVVGLYGVVSYAARQRRHDVAIRMALGADRGSVVELFVRQSLVVVAAGLGVGSLLGVALGHALEGQLHGVAPGDLPTHVAIAGLLAATAAAAVWIPSRRAARADPMGVLREE